MTGSMEIHAVGTDTGHAVRHYHDASKERGVRIRWYESIDQELDVSGGYICRRGESVSRGENEI